MKHTLLLRNYCINVDLYGFRSGARLFVGNSSGNIRFLVEMNVKLVFFLNNNLNIWEEFPTTSLRLLWKMLNSQYIYVHVCRNSTSVEYFFWECRGYLVEIGICFHVSYNREGSSRRTTSSPVHGWKDDILVYNLYIFDNLGIRV